MRVRLFGGEDESSRAEGLRPFRHRARPNWQEKRCLFIKTRHLTVEDMSGRRMYVYLSRRHL